MLNFLINKKVNFINYNYSKNIIKYNKIEIIKLLLNIININDQVFDGYSIIYWCIYYNNQVLFKYLLTCSDLDISKYDRYKCSPLYWISYRNNIELLKILHISDIKINVNIANEFNVVPLHWAVINNNLEMVKLLIEMGADVNITNKLNSTSLYYAVRNQNIDIIKYLKNHNAITNIIKDNETIVEYAKHLKNQNIINLIEN
jgi:ankyrin repeat protein